MLFNAFIFAQLANLINSRRINDEYNIFQNIFASPVFLCVLCICGFLQVGRRAAGLQGCRAAGRSSWLRCSVTSSACAAPDPRACPSPACLFPPSQAIIINFIYVVFKVRPLDWQEWLATIAIGAGAIPWSLIVRGLSKALGPWLAGLEFRRHRASYTQHKQTVQRRSMSGRPDNRKSLSGRPGEVGRRSNEIVPVTPGDSMVNVGLMKSASGKRA